MDYKSVMVYPKYAIFCNAGFMKNHTTIHELLTHCLTRGKTVLTLSVLKILLLQSRNVATLLLKLCHSVPFKERKFSKLIYS